MRSLAERATALLSSDRFPFIVAILSLLLAIPALRFGLMFDDYMQRAVFLQPNSLDGLFGTPFADFFTFLDGDPVRTQALIDRGIFPWYAQPDALIRFWRPLTVATHWVDYSLWPDTPWLMHAHSLVWFGALVLAAGAYYRRMMGPGPAAGLAVLLFAMDDAHAWPVAWLANRNALIALVFGAIALSMHDRWRSAGQRRGGVAAVVFFSFALLAKESAVGICGYVVAYAFFVDRNTMRSRMLSALPYMVVAILWQSYYIHAGYGSSGASGYVDPVREPLQFAQKLFVRAPVFLLGQWGFPPSDLYTLGPPAQKIIFVVLGLILTVVLAIVIVPLLRRDSVARFWCAGMLLALAPLCAVDPQDRLLMFPGLGAMGLLARFLVSVREQVTSGPSGVIARRLTRPVYYGLIAVHLIVAPLMLPGTIIGLKKMTDITANMTANVIPSDSAVTDKTIVFANASSYPIGTYLFITRALSGDPVPAYLRSLAPASMTGVSIVMTRLDRYALSVRPLGGYPWSLGRDESHAFSTGDEIPLPGLTVTIRSLAQEGWPEEVVFRFDKPLDDPNYLWYRVENTDLVPFVLPAIDQTIQVDPFGIATRE